MKAVISFLYLTPIAIINLLLLGIPCLLFGKNEEFDMLGKRLKNITQQIVELLES